jgi:hypothetical protein
MSMVCLEYQLRIPELVRFGLKFNSNFPSSRLIRQAIGYMPHPAIGNKAIYCIQQVVHARAFFDIMFLSYRMPMLFLGPF